MTDSPAYALVCVTRPYQVQRKSLSGDSDKCATVKGGSGGAKWQVQKHGLLLLGGL